MSDPQTPPPPPTFRDLAFHGAENAADGLLSGVPELRSVLVVFDWAVPVGTEVAPGVAFTRGPDGLPAEVRNPLPLFGLLQQHGRMGLALATRFQQILLAANQAADDMAKRINERKRELEVLTDAAARLEERVAAVRAAAPAAEGGPPGDQPAGGP